MLQTPTRTRTTHRVVLSDDAFLRASLHIIRGATLDMHAPLRVPTPPHAGHQPSAIGTKMRSLLRWTSSATASGLGASAAVSCATD